MNCKICAKLVPYKVPDISPYERPLTDKELETFGKEFSSYASRGFTLPTTEFLEKFHLFQGAIKKISSQFDQSAMNLVPGLKYLAGTRVVELVK